MLPDLDTPPSVAHLQDLGHDGDHDYEPGSPHLTHSQLRRQIISTLEELVADGFAASNSCSVLEIGAGHGQFTDHLLAFGAEVTATEMSRSSAERMARRYANNPRATVVLDSDGSAVSALPGEFDVVFAASVLHHIPDYLAAIGTWLPRIARGGSFYSVEDPILYSRQRPTTRLAQRSAYYAWRMARPDRFDSVRNNLRRRAGQWDEARESDMVEYHVLRDGVDEAAICALLEPSFQHVEVRRYWSTPSALLQRAGERWAQPTNFAIVARGKR